MSVSPATIASLVIAISFAAGLNVYATILTLGVMSRLHWIVLPSSLDVLASGWVIGASGLLFAAEFVADKIPGFDLIWNAAHTFVRIPVALLLAYGATSHLSPELQMLVTVLGGAIAAIAHGSKLAVRGAVTASPEPFSNIALSSGEDVFAVGLTWAATLHPLIAGLIAAIAVVAAVMMTRVVLRSIRGLWSRLPARSRTKAVTTIAIAAVVLAFAPPNSASSQMLARPGWTASSSAAPASWNHAVLYEIDTRSFQDSNGDGTGDLKGIAQHLDYLQALGVDAILIDSLTPVDASTTRTLTAPIDPSLGTIDDFDALSLEASRHKIRILLELAKPDPALARFWLTRGVAGFRIGSKTDAAGMPELRKLMAGYAGRILITDAGSAAAPSALKPPAKSPANELVLDTDILRLPAAMPDGTAALLRAALEHSQTLLRGPTVVLATDAQGLPRSANRFAVAGGHPADLARVLGAVLLLNRSAAMIYAGQELGLSSPDGKPVPMPWGAQPVAATPAPPPPRPVQPANSEAYVPYIPPPVPPKRLPPDPASAAGQELDPNSVLSFYRQLVLLHHGNTALRDGEQVTLNHDGENALVWVRRPKSPTYQNPAIVIVCNLSEKPLVISLKTDLARLHLRGSFLRKLLRSDGGLGSMDVDPTSVPPFGVYAGELKY